MSRKASPQAPLPARLLAAFLLVSASFSLVSFILIQFGIIALTPNQARHFQNNLPLEQALTLLMAASEVLGSLAVLGRNPGAIWFFASALAITVFITILRGLDFGIFAALGGAGIFATLFGWGLLGAICVYTWDWRRVSKKPQ